MLVLLMNLNKKERKEKYLQTESTNVHIKSKKYFITIMVS